MWAALFVSYGVVNKRNVNFRGAVFLLSRPWLFRETIIPNFYVGIQHGCLGEV